MKNVQEHFDSEAQHYDNLILTLIPYYNKMTDVLIEGLPFNEKEDLNILDLGCGTGNISQKIKKRFSTAHITCVDLSENMINIAKNKLSDYSNIVYKLADFQNVSLDDNYDAVVSSLAMHHLETDSDKKNLYVKIFNSLSDGGVFYNADVVLGSSDYLQDMYIQKWKEFMALNHSQEDIENKWMPTHRAEDNPSKMSDHIKWLDEAGFKKVDVLWKYYNYGVYGGVK